MRLTADDGRVLDAEYTAQADGPHVAVIVSSRAGPSGSRPPQNPDYNPALTLLPERLGQLGAVLAGALVDSRHTRALGLPESERRLIEAPVRLAAEPDMNALRLKMAAAQARIGQAPGAAKGGNTTKRVRLRVDVPGFGPADASRLAAVLISAAVCRSNGRQARRSKLLWISSAVSSRTSVMTVSGPPSPRQARATPASYIRPIMATLV